MKNIVKFFIAVFCLPLVFFFLKEISVLAWHITLNFKVALFFIGGGILYLPLHFFVYDFSRPYVAAHEFTHAIAALFFGYQVKSVKIKKRSGAVKLNDYNEAVVLAPYVLPLYFVMCLFVFAVLTYNGFNGEYYKNAYSFVLGFLFSFHITHTVITLTEVTQPDLRMAGGVVFSLFCITLFNLLFIMLFIALIFPENIAVWPTLKSVFTQTFVFWQKVLNYIIYHVIEILRL
ncbi:hypothetical protein AAIR98_001890 [Elusimicrobium simillimum]|uniref:hypothetical protein n=1 Tax=Elusimicrobium simillimum TaxID=3143438 RepID=UPI003C6F0973